MFDNSYLKLARNTSPNGSLTATLLDPSHPATKLKPQQFPLWQADGIKIKLVPMALLQKPVSQCSGEDPFTRHFVTWAERIQHAKKAGMKVVSTDLVGAQNQRIEDNDLFPKSELGNKRLPGYRSAPRGALKDLTLKKLALRIPMSYITATSKERMGQKTHMRRRVTTRIKTALNLIVARGAYVDQSEIQNGAGQVKGDESEIKQNPLPGLKFDNEEASLMGEKWIMQGTVYRYNNFYQLEMPYISTHLGWSYIFYPTTEIYNMPYPKLVTLLRQGLKFLYKTATELERRWLKEALRPQPLPRLKYEQTDPSRTNKNTREKPTKPAVEPSTHEHQVEMSSPSSSPGSAYGVVEKPQKSGPNRVHRVENPTAVKPELWESQLLSGLAIMQERLGKRVRRSTRRCVLILSSAFLAPSISTFNVRL